VIASVHIANIGAGKALGVLRKAPQPGSTPGLLKANVATTAPLSGSLRPSPDFGRVGLIAFWENDEAITRFLADDPMAAKLAGGFHVRLEPLRAHGSWPGLPADVPKARTITHEGVAAVLTLARTRVSQLPRFLRTSAKAEARAIVAPGMIWATGLARPPFFATFSLWQSAEALSTYAYDSTEPAHPNAIAEDRAKEFHHQSAFIRFRPYGSEGSLSGKNPLPESWMSTA
jgi:hypothetical protein